MNAEQVIDRLRSALDEVVAEPANLESAPPVGRRHGAPFNVRVLAVAAATVALLGTGVWVVVQSGDPDPTQGPSVGTVPIDPTLPSEPPSSATAATSQGQLLVTGIVREPNGEPAVGARVEAMLDPNMDTLSTMEIGDSYELTTIAQVVTDASGQFEIRVRPRALAQFVSADRFADFTFWATHENAYAMWGFSRQLTRNGSFVPEDDDDADEMYEDEPQVLATTPATGPEGKSRPEVETEPAETRRSETRPPSVIHSVVDGTPHLDMTLTD